MRSWGILESYSSIRKSESKTTADCADNTDRIQGQRGRSLGFLWSQGGPWDQEKKKKNQPASRIIRAHLRNQRFNFFRFHYELFAAAAIVVRGRGLSALGNATRL
jgi:hypothetical protein